MPLDLPENDTGSLERLAAEQGKSRAAVLRETVLVRDRVFVTRNFKDFPARMPGIRVPYTL